MSRLHSLLRKKKKPNKCGFCHIVIVKDDTHSGVFYKVDPEEEGESGTIHQVGTCTLLNVLCCTWSVAACWYNTCCVHLVQEIPSLVSKRVTVRVQLCGMVAALYNTRERRRGQLVPPAAGHLHTDKRNARQSALL